VFPGRLFSARAIHNVNGEYLDFQLSWRERQISHRFLDKWKWSALEMLKHRKESMASYMNQIPHGNFGVETRRVVRQEKFNKYAKIPVVRFFLATYFIIKDDAFIRPHKPDPNKPMFYRRGIWRVHNCGQRKDGTFYTSGNAVLWIFEDGKEVFDSSQSDLPYTEIRVKLDEKKRSL
jgi:hypothetical protein